MRLTHFQEFRNMKGSIRWLYLPDEPVITRDETCVASKGVAKSADKKCTRVVARDVASKACREKLSFVLHLRGTWGIKSLGYSRLFIQPAVVWNGIDSRQFYCPVRRDAGSSGCPARNATQLQHCEGRVDYFGNFQLQPSHFQHRDGRVDHHSDF